MNCKLLVLCCVLSCLGLGRAAGQPPPNSMEALLALVREEQVDPYQVSVAASELARLYPQSHPQFLDLFRNAQVLRNKRWLFKLMNDHKLPGLEQAITLALADPQRLLRADAAAFLPTIRDQAAFLEQLSKALQDPDLEVRCLAAKAFAGEPAAIERLPQEAVRLASDRDPLIRRAFLANIGPSPAVVPSVRPLFVQALQDRQAMTCLSAAEGAARLQLFRPGQLGDAYEPVLASLVARLADADPAVAGAAGCALRLVWNGDVERAVRQALTADNLIQRARAADLLRKTNVPFDPQPLQEVLTRGSEEEQLYVCGTLARVQTEACVPPAQAALASQFPSVRQAAVYALEVLECPAALAVLVRALGHTDANVRYRAAIVLGRRKDSATAAQALCTAARAEPELHVQQAVKIAAALAGGGGVASVLSDRARVLADAARLPAKRLAAAAGRPTVVQEGIAQVGTQKQLLVDDLVLDDLGGAHRTLHKFRKDPRNPVLEQQFPWELMGTLSYCTTVRYDPRARLFSFWYTSLGRVAKAGEAIASRAQCLAYSTDGIHWVRPHLGLYEFQGSRANNLVGRASNMLYLPDQPDAGRRFASYIYQPKLNALAVSFSPDGMSGWTEWAQVCGGGADVDTVCLDPLGDGYFAFMKWRVGRWHRRAAWSAWGSTPDKMKRGLINVTAGLADDRESAARLAAAFPGLDFFQPRVFRTEVYEVVPFIYEGIYFGFPIRFDVSGPGGRNVDGQTDLTVLFSRDKNGAGGWLRPGTEDYLRAATGDAESENVEPLASPLVGVLDHGLWGQWDATQHYGPSSVLVLDDEIVLYYCGGSFGHEPEGSRSDAAGKNVYRTAIGRATLRLDGLVSLDAGRQEAAIVTKPLAFRGRELAVNADCRRGQLCVELLDKDGGPLPGFAAGTSDAFREDSVRHVVTWSGQSDLSALAGQPIRIKFRLANGQLYSFQFTTGR